jgi:NAD(P)-dependent dehydrogenase (short-subunit alcohol dehydrogenase family)
MDLRVDGRFVIVTAGAAGVGRAIVAALHGAGGRVTAGDWSPHLRTGTGYVRLAEAGDWIGSPVDIEDPAGDHHPATIVALPL